MNGNEKALIYKDINEITSSKRVIMPMTIVPIIMVVVIPLAILIGASFTQNDSNMFTKIAPLLKKLPSEYTRFAGNPDHLDGNAMLNASRKAIDYLSSIEPKSLVIRLAKGDSRSR